MAARVGKQKRYAALALLTLDQFPGCLTSNRLEPSICSSMVPSITAKMSALTWQFCAESKHRRMMDKWVKTFSPSVILQGHVCLQTSMRHRTIPLEMTIPTPVWPHEKALLLIHCYHTTLQLPLKNFSLSLPLEKWANYHNFKLFPITRREHKSKKGLKNKKTTAFRSPT